MKRVLLLAAAAALASAQDFSQRGFFEASGQFYPRAAPNDRSHAVGEALFRYEAFFKPLPGLEFAGGIDARADTHLQTVRQWELSWSDRERRRPAFALRRLSATYARGKLLVEAGKQFIHWGKTDVLNPTDRFAPRDYVNVVNTEDLAVTAARVTYGGQTDTVEAVYAPRLTPSRVPLPDQRWSPLPAGIPVRELAPDFPGGGQAGVRWNHLGRAAEYALSFYEGYDHLPLLRGQAGSSGVTVQRFYPRMRMYGFAGAAPLPLLTFKWEAAYFTSSNQTADNYALYVAQVERQSGEWFLVAGYAGQAVTRHGAAPGFSPVRGFTRSVVGRAGYTIDANRSFAFEGVARQNGRGLWLKAEYSQAFGQHWRVTGWLAWIRGAADDFVGQFHRNSHAGLRLRYSF